MKTEPLTILDVQRRDGVSFKVAAERYCEQASRLGLAQSDPELFNASFEEYVAWMQQRLNRQCGLDGIA